MHSKAEQYLPLNPLITHAGSDRFDAAERGARLFTESAHARRFVANLKAEHLLPDEELKVQRYRTDRLHCLTKLAVKFVTPARDDKDLG